MLSFLQNRNAVNLREQFPLQSLQLLSNEPILHLFSSLVPETKRIFIGKNIWKAYLATTLKPPWQYFSKISEWLRKSFGVHHWLLLMIEIWKKAVYNKNVFAALITDLSKTFDCVSQDLLFSILICIRTVISNLKPMQDYLQNRKQRNKIETIFS